LPLLEPLTSSGPTVLVSNPRTFRRFGSHFLSSSFFALNKSPAVRMCFPPPTRTPLGNRGRGILFFRIPSLLPSDFIHFPYSLKKLEIFSLFFPLACSSLWHASFYCICGCLFLRSRRGFKQALSLCLGPFFSPPISSYPLPLLL